MMTMDEMLAYVQTKVATQLNTEFKAKGLKELNFIDSPPDAETSSYECGVYIASPGGKSYVHDGLLHFVSVAFDGVLSSDIDRSDEPQKYLSILVRWANKVLGSLTTQNEEGYVLRVDIGNSKNYFGYFVEICFAIDNDGNI